MKHFEIVQTLDGTQQTTTVENINAFAAVNNIAITGLHDNPRTRDELQGHPELSGYAGPCWGGTSESGEAIIRYEDAQTYADLSF